MPRLLLASTLKKEGLLYDERIDACHNFVYDIGDLTINDVIKAVELEDFIMNETNYKEMVSIYGKKRAREMALQEYFCKNDNFAITFD